MAIVMGSEEAREVLQNDFWRRKGDLELWSPKGEEPPEHYVSGDWRDAFPTAEEDEDEWIDVPGELSGGNIVRSGWDEEKEE